MRYEIMLNCLLIGAVCDGRPSAVNVDDGRRALLLAEAAQQGVASERSVAIEHRSVKQ